MARVKRKGQPGETGAARPKNRRRGSRANVFYPWESKRAEGLPPGCLEKWKPVLGTQLLNEFSRICNCHSFVGTRILPNYPRTREGLCVNFSWDSWWGL